MRSFILKKVVTHSILSPEVLGVYFKTKLGDIPVYNCETKEDWMAFTNSEQKTFASLAKYVLTHWDEIQKEFASYILKEKL